MATDDDTDDDDDGDDDGDHDDDDEDALFFLADPPALIRSMVLA